MSDWPWEYVRGFKVESQADGNMLVTPDWNPERVMAHTNAGGGGPGLGLRLGMAEWIEQRLKKRGRR